MYKLSVPISMNTINDETLPVYLEQVKESQAERVFLCGFGQIYTEQSVLHKDTERVQRAIQYFQENGLEVGVWINSFGHGIVLVQNEPQENKSSYTCIEGIDGETVAEAYCPLDGKFTTDYRNAVKRLAALHPDIIMLDDDFRLNARHYYMGCFCPLHLKEYYKRIGEEIPRERLEKLIFTGGENQYRAAYMELMRDSLLDFAKMLRSTVDEVDENIRMGAAGAPDNIDYSGTDLIEIAKAFAGKTKPFTRTIGAPYWKEHLSGVIEDARMQIAWCKDSGVEIFTEGDSYPRPRYNVPSKVLELFDFALLADNSADGILKYIFDYMQKPDYETGYIKMHIRKLGMREGIYDMFQDKRPVGVRAYNEMHKVKNWSLPKECSPKIATRLGRKGYRSTSRYLLALNSIPSIFEESDYPILLCGENAKYIKESDLQHGAILDIPAARILMEAGVDTGLISEESGRCVGEYFSEEQDTIRGFKDVATKKIKCSEKAEVLSVFVPDETPAAYTYENAKGQRFYVLAHDLFMSNACANYFNNYYRQAQMIKAVEWLCGKKLPAVSVKNPNLYILSSANEQAMAVALANICQDEIFEPVVQLDKKYHDIKFLNCSGRLKGDKVYLSEIPPYGFAAFEVK